MAKNPVLAAFLSFLLPGMGQIYVGKILFGISLIVLSFLISTLTIAISIFGIILYVIIWLYAIYDAYLTAKNYTT
jgi:TM2 domain-containing membrane protein YozV